jgi:hypothetical protein
MTPALAGDLQNFHRATQGMWRCTAASLFISQRESIIQSLLPAVKMQMKIILI